MESLVKNEEKGDLSNPHFSVNSAVNGILSSSLPANVRRIYYVVKLAPNAILDNNGSSGSDANPYKIK